MCKYLHLTSRPDESAWAITLIYISMRSMRIHNIAELVIIDINNEVKNYHSIWNKDITTKHTGMSTEI